MQRITKAPSCKRSKIKISYYCKSKIKLSNIRIYRIFKILGQNIFPDEKLAKKSNFRYLTIVYNKIQVKKKYEYVLNFFRLRFLYYKHSYYP